MDDPMETVEDKSIPTTLSPRDLAKETKTDVVLVDPLVVSKLMDFAARHHRNEVGGLLLGRIEGRFLLVEGIVFAEKVGTSVNIHFSGSDFEKAQAALRDGQAIVGWAHSHPTYTAFMSTTDARFQTQGQALFPDYVALVLDPFRPKGVEFCFFRIKDERAVQVPHHYWRASDAP